MTQGNRCIWVLVAGGLGLACLTGCTRTYNYVSEQMTYLFTPPNEPALANVPEPDTPKAQRDRTREGRRDDARRATANMEPAGRDTRRAANEPAVALALPQAQPEPAREGAAMARRTGTASPPSAGPPTPSRLTEPRVDNGAPDPGVRRAAGPGLPSGKRAGNAAMLPSAPGNTKPGTAPDRAAGAMVSPGRTTRGDGPRAAPSKTTARPSLHELPKGSHRPGAGGLRQLLEHMLSLARARKQDDLRKAMEQLEAKSQDLRYLIGPERTARFYLPYAYRQRRLRGRAQQELTRRALSGNTRFHVKATKRGVDEGGRVRMYRQLYGWMGKNAVLYRVYFQTDRTLTEDGPFVHLNGRWLHLLGLGSSTRQR